VRPRRAHRYRIDDDEQDDEKAATGPIPPLRPRADEPGRVRVPRAELPRASVGQREPEFSPPAVRLPAPQQSAAPPATAPPERTTGRRAKREAAAAAPAAAAPAPPTTKTPTNGDRVAQRPAPDVPATPKAKKAPRLVSKRGWRRWVHTFTRINFGLSRDEKYDLDLRARVRRSPRGSYEIGVLGLKGGVGKTTLTAALGSMLAQVRGDRILVVDADPGCGNLADRTGRSSTATIADLLSDKDLSHYNDVRTYTSVNSVNLEVLPAAEYSAARRGLSGEDWRFAADAVSKFYNLVLTDCGAGFFDPVTRGAISTASAVVIVTSASVDSAKQAQVALDWLRKNGHQDLLNRACVVVNHVTPEETNVESKDLVRQFEQQVQPGRVVVLPWDKHIAAGTEIQLGVLDPTYKRRVLELAAALSDDFEGAGRR
jgi:MinD-like ATPase involved in chromosome partitioning or flagellar assembly